MEHLPSKLAVGGIIAGVSVYEAFAPKDELISDQTERIRSHKLGNIAVQALVWSTAAHLSGLLPEKYDWLHQITRLKRQAISPPV